MIVNLVTDWYNATGGAEMPESRLKPAFEQLHGPGTLRLLVSRP